MEHSQSIASIAKALAAAQSKVGHAIKEATNPHFGKAYADLKSVVEACREPMTANGLSVSHCCDSADGQLVTINCLLMHESGEWIKSSLALRPTKPDAQGVGSAITYGRRYTLAAMMGVATEDDDGNGASQQPERAPAKRQTKPEPEQASPPDQQESPRQRFIRSVSEWSGVPIKETADIGSACKQTSKKLGLPEGKATDEQLAQACEAIKELMRKKEDFKKWVSAKPKPAFDSNGNPVEDSQ